MAQEKSVVNETCKRGLINRPRVLVHRAADFEIDSAQPRRPAAGKDKEFYSSCFNGQFTAWTSRGGNSSAGSLPVPKHGLFGFLGVTKI